MPEVRLGWCRQKSFTDLDGVFEADPAEPNARCLFGCLFRRLTTAASAHVLHKMPPLRGVADEGLNTDQCFSALDELAFIADRANDPLLIGLAQSGLRLRSHARPPTGMARTHRIRPVAPARRVLLSSPSQSVRDSVRPSKPSATRDCCRIGLHRAIADHAERAAFWAAKASSNSTGVILPRAR